MAAKKKIEWFEVENMIDLIDSELTKAGYLIQDVLEDYLEKIHIHDPDVRIVLYCEHDRALAKTQLIEDILGKIRQLLTYCDEFVEEEQQEQQDQHTDPVSQTENNGCEGRKCTVK